MNPSPRSIIITLIVSIFYLTVIYQLFFLENIFTSLLFVFLFFISYHFFFIEVQRYHTKYFLLGLIIITIIEWILIGFSDRHLLAAITFFNTAIFVLSTDIQIPTQSRVYFNSISYFTTGGYLFTVLIAFTYSIALLGISKNFPFSCDGLSSASNHVIETFTNPFKIGIDKANQIKNDTQMFFSSSLGDILTKPKQDNPSYLSQKITNYKSVMIDQVIQDNSYINMGICDYILQEITKRYDKPVFQFSVIVLMYLLFYPFLRIIFWIMSFIGLTIFKLLYLLKVYKIKKIKKEVEQIN